MQNPFLAGWGEADITPDAETVELTGQYYQRLAEGLHSPLRAVALVLSQGSEHTVLITLDVVGISTEFAARVRASIAVALPELSAANITINAIHTHNAPELKSGRSWWQSPADALPVEAYQAFVEKRIIEAARMAHACRRPATTAAVLAAARVGHCRRAVYTNGTAEMYGCTDREDFVGMESGEDSGVELLFFYHERDKPCGVIVNVACPSQVMEATRLISSDYMGALRDKLKKVFGEDFHTLCQIGAAGCQSPRDLTRGYKGEPDFWHADGVEVLSERLCTAVRQAAAVAPQNMDPSPLLAQRALTLSLPRRRAGYTDYIAARNELAQLEAVQDSATAYADFCARMLRNEAIPGRPGPYDDKLHRFVLMRNAEAVVRRYEEQAAKPDFDMMLHIVRIGRTVIATNPFELFLEYGQRIKARSCAQQTLVVQLANGSGGYLPTPRAEGLGGYGGLIINGQVGSDGGALLVDRTLEEIRALWNES